jgi:hypothetical protein
MVQEVAELDTCVPVVVDWPHLEGRGGKRNRLFAREPDGLSVGPSEGVSAELPGNGQGKVRVANPQFPRAEHFEESSDQVLGDFFSGHCGETMTYLIRRAMNRRNEDQQQQALPGRFHLRLADGSDQAAQDFIARGSPAPVPGAMQVLNQFRRTREAGQNLGMCCQSLKVFSMSVRGEISDQVGFDPANEA